MNENFSLFLKPNKKPEPFITNENYPNFDEFDKIQSQFLTELEKPLQSKKRKERQSELAFRMCHVFELILADPNVRVNANELFLLLYGDLSHTIAAICQFFKAGFHLVATFRMNA